MSFSTKDWADGSVGGTPIDAAALKDAEQRLSTYTDTRVAAGGSITAVRKELGVAARTPTEFPEDEGDEAIRVTEAIEAVREEGQTNGSNYGEVWLPAGAQRLERDPVKGGVTLGNAQIPLPVINPKTEEKFTLVLIGAAVDATGNVPHWHQEPVQGGGTTLDSFAEETFDAEWGSPSVIGGPTNFTDPVSGANGSFSNMLVVTKGLTVRQKLNPTMIGIDAQQIAQSNLIRCSATVRATVAEMGENLPTAAGGIAVRLPFAGNNDNNTISGGFTSYGHYTALCASEHLVADRIASIYANKSLELVGYVNEGEGASEANHVHHGGFIGYMSSEVVATCHVVAAGGASTRYPIEIGLLSCESGAATYDIIDTENVLAGTINWESVAGEPGIGAAPRLNGAKRLKVLNTLNYPGVAASPAVPASGTEIRDTQFRDGLMPIIGGTGLEVFVNGTKVSGFPATGGQPILWPSGGYLKLVYTEAPTFGSRMLT